jgi:hypothetical protein
VAGSGTTPLEETAICGFRRASGRSPLQLKKSGISFDHLTLAYSAITFFSFSLKEKKLDDMV